MIKTQNKKYEFLLKSNEHIKGALISITSSILSHGSHRIGAGGLFPISL